MSTVLENQHEQVFQILTNVKNQNITVESGTEAILLLFNPLKLKNFRISFHSELLNIDNVWITLAKDDVEAVDLFWKSHDVLDTILETTEI